MAENLYSKYRPKILSEVYGQATIVKELQKRTKENTFPQVVYLTGFTGTGKSTLEKIISKTILCQHKDDSGNPCCICETCLTIQNEKPSNYYYLFNASNLGIDEMRNIENLSQMKSLSTSKHKVIVIDELQELVKSPAASKNLLKAIEKPNAYTHFMLLSMDDSKIPVAIKNRCVPYKLKPLDFTDIAKYLYFICKSEGVVIDTKEKMETLATIADNSNGSVRTAVSYLERCIYSDIWEKDEILAELNLISTENLVNIMNLILSGKIQALDFIDPTKEFIDKLRYSFNQLYKYKAGLELDAYKLGLIKGIVKCNVDVIATVMETFTNIMQFNYLNAEIIETSFINLILQIQNFKERGGVTIVSEQPRRRMAKES